MRHLFLFIAACCFILGAPTAAAQVISVVSPEGKTTLYTEVKAALDAAPSGSFVYLPGNPAGFDFYDVKIEKELHLVGVGYRNDLNPVDGATVITGNFSLGEKATNSSFTGLRFTGRVTLSPNTPEVEGDGANNVLFKRCFLNSLHTDIYKPVTKLRVTECEVEKYVYGRFDNCEIDHCLFYPDGDACTSIAYGQRFHHNIVLRFYLANGVSNSYFYDNIIVNLEGIGGKHTGCNLTDFHNNLVCATESQIDGALLESDPQKVFVNFSFEGLQDGKVRKGNFHLAEGSVALTAASDGGQLGIYGGTTPWKDSTHPFNPHVNKAVISDIAQPDGTIKVMLEVSDDGY